jgi:Protein of unknown function (DUF3300)
MIMRYALVLSHAWTRERTNILRRAADASLHEARVSRAFAQLGRRALAAVLCPLLIPVGQADLLAQQSVPPPPPDSTSPAPVQPLTPGQLNQLVAPIALYPDTLIAQILAASTYPIQIVDADRWRRSQSGTSQQIASKANGQSWDPSVKALTAFPTVLAQLDKNLDWTENLGNAYYNQPQDVMDAIHAMRQRAQASGNLKSSAQETVSTANGNIIIAPANPSVVYVPVYNPWAVYGAPLAVYPGFYYAPPAGIVFGSALAIGFGVGIGIGVFAHWGWGWNNWRLGWHSRAVLFNHTTYITHSRTVINHGFNRPGGPGRGVASRRSYARAARVNHGAEHSVTQSRAVRAGHSADFGSRGGFRGVRFSGGGRRGGSGRR